MYHQQLANHVRSKIKEGLHAKTIRDELAVDGWSEDDIDEAFYYATSPKKLKGFSLIKIFHSEIPLALAMVLVIMVVIGAGAFVFFNDRSLNYTVNLSVSPGNKQLAFSYGVQSALSNPDFFEKVKQKFIADQVSFVEANLSTMTARAYQKGELVVEVPIKTKGREGSWWETPAGLYKISSKEKSHFSSMGHVYQPWSMNFQGNFYIHGWPYYPDGTAVASTYSGGCIRLETADAKKIFDVVEVGTPILVFENDFSSDNFVYTENGPNLSATSFLAADLRNNNVFTGKASTVETPIASITKLMTALVATEYLNLDSVAVVPKKAEVFTSKPRLKAGMKLSIYQLLFPLLMESSNEAAETIANYYGRNLFVQRMNEKAAAIGMTHTKFTDSSGADIGNVSTPEDLFMLAKYIYNNRSFIFKITAGKVESSAYGSSTFTNLSNLNDFSGSEYFFGGKVGKTTEANESNLSVFELPVGETKRPIIFIVLNSQNRKSDTQTLIDYTLTHFR